MAHENKTAEPSNLGLSQTLHITPIDSILDIARYTNKLVKIFGEETVLAPFKNKLLNALCNTPPNQALDASIAHDGKFSWAIAELKRSNLLKKKNGQLWIQSPFRNFIQNQLKPGAELRAQKLREARDLLIDGGNEKESIERMDDTALVIAAYAAENAEAVMKPLLAAEINLDPVLYVAVKTRDKALAQWLIEKGADADMKDSEGRSLLYNLVVPEFDIAMATLLLDNGVEIDDDILNQAASPVMGKDQIGMLCLLMSRIEDLSVDALNRALELAAEQCNIKITMLLLEAGTDDSTPFLDLDSINKMAGKNPHALADFYAADLSIEKMCGTSLEGLLIKAVEKGYDHVVEGLLLAGADPGCTSYYKGAECPILYIAIIRCHTYQVAAIEIIELLLKHGANPHALPPLGVDDVGNGWGYYYDIGGDVDNLLRKYKSQRRENKQEDGSRLRVKPHIPTVVVPTHAANRDSCVFREKVAQFVQAILLQQEGKLEEAKACYKVIAYSNEAAFPVITSIALGNLLNLAEESNDLSLRSECYKEFIQRKNPDFIETIVRALKTRYAEEAEKKEEEQKSEQGTVTHFHLLEHTKNLYLLIAAGHVFDVNTFTPQEWSFIAQDAMANIYFEKEVKSIEDLQAFCMALETPKKSTESYLFAFYAAQNALELSTNEQEEKEAEEIIKGFKEMLQRQFEREFPELALREILDKVDAMFNEAQALGIVKNKKEEADHQLPIGTSNPGITPGAAFAQSVRTVARVAAEKPKLQSLDSDEEADGGLSCDGN